MTTVLQHCIATSLFLGIVKLGINYTSQISSNHSQ